VEKSTGGMREARARRGTIRDAFRKLSARARSAVGRWRRRAPTDHSDADPPGGHLRRRLRIALLLLLLAGIGGIVFRATIVRRHAPSELTPQTALFYLEVRDPLRVLDGLRSTRALSDLLSGVPQWSALWEKLPHQVGEWGWLARSPMALVVTGMEWEGEIVRPQLALLWTTERSDDALRRFAETQGLALARRAYGTFTVQRTVYLEAPIVGYRATASENGFFWSACAKTLIVATHPDALRAIIETARGRRPSLDAHPRLRALRRAVERVPQEPASSRPWWERERASPIWGWISGEALARGARVIAAPALPPEIARAMRDALSVSVAFAVRFDDGDVVTRYVLALDPKWVKRYSPILRPNTPVTEEALLRLIPRRVRHFTLYRWTDARELAAALEETLATQLPEPLRAVLAGTLARMRRALGWDPEDTLADALGSALAVVDTGDPTLLLLVSVRNAPKLAALIGKHFARTGARVRETSVHGVALFASEAHPERAFAFLERCLLIGHPKQIERVLRARARGETASDDPALRARLSATEGFEITVTFEHPETARALWRALLWLERASAMAIRAPDAETAYRRAQQWPPSVRTSSLRPEGLWSESRSPLGPLAFLLQIVEGGEGE